jgi:hypothetical protein
MNTAVGIATIIGSAVAVLVATVASVRYLIRSEFDSFKGSLDARYYAKELAEAKQKETDRQLEFLARHLEKNA